MEYILLIIGNMDKEDRDEQHACEQKAENSTREKIANIWWKGENKKKNGLIGN